MGETPQQTGSLPPATARPCDECPWRKDSIPGWLGPWSAEEWFEIAHSDVPIACHKTIKVSGSWEGAKQCRGAASYRENSCKSPKDPEVAVGPKDHRIFRMREFIAHHTQRLT